MTIQEAAKSGNPFTRPGDKTIDGEKPWLIIDDCGVVRFQNNNKEYVPYGIDLLADDWVIKPISLKATISYDEFLEIFHKLWLQEPRYAHLVEGLAKQFWGKEKAAEGEPQDE
jgi:hypothetical protein